jgi:hypothetical protein
MSSDAEPNNEQSEETGAHDEAQRAADSLKEQIAAVRARIRDAHETLREHARRDEEPKTFKR